VSQQINLFNPIFLKQKKYFSVVTMLQALVLILLGSVLVYGYAQYEVQQLQEQSAEATRRFEDAQNRLTRYAAEYSPQQANLLLQEQLKKTETDLAAQQELINTLKSGAIGNTQGYSPYMRAFARQVVPGLWLTAFSITGDGAQMSLSGGVLNPGLLPEYIRRLDREEIMYGKTFASLQMSKPKAKGEQPAVSRYVEFTLQSVETGEAPK